MSFALNARDPIGWQTMIGVTRQQLALCAIIRATQATVSIARRVDVSLGYAFANDCNVVHETSLARSMSCASTSRTISSRNAVWVKNAVGILGGVAANTKQLRCLEDK